MANLEELVVSLVAETSGLRAELANASKITKDATSKMDSAIEEFSKNSSKNVGFFESSMATMTGFLGSQAVLGVVNMVKDGIGALGAELVEGAQSAIAEENALKRLANSLALSGQYSESAITGLKNFAGEMEALTGIGDDVVASNLAVLSSLTKLDSEGLKRAQKAALDLAAATGMDLNAATTLVAKGIEGQTSAFTRYGIQIQASSDRAQNLSNVLGTLESRFGGAAAGAAQTFGGAVINLTNAWGNLTESIATSITQNPVVIAMLSEITKILGELTGSSDAAGESLKTGVANALLAVTQIVGTLALETDTWIRTFMATVQGLKIALDAIVGSLNWIGNAMGIISDDDPFSHLKASVDSLDQTLNGQTALSQFADGLAQVQGAGERAFSSIGQGSGVVTASIQNQKVSVDSASEAYKKLLTTYATGLADQGAALDNFYSYENEIRAANLENQLIAMQDNNAMKYELMAEDFVIQQEMQAAQHEKEQADLEAARIKGILTKDQYYAALTALAQKHSLENKKLETESLKFQMDNNKQRTDDQRSTYAYLSTLASSSSKELAMIGKAAAVSQATIDGILAVQKALSAFPPPINFVMAGLVGVAAAANIAKISGVSLNEGGTLQGGGMNKDTVPAMLTKGETVVTRDLTTKLEEFLNRQGEGATGDVVRVELTLRDSLIEFIEAKILERQTSNVSLITVGT